MKRKLFFWQEKLKITPHERIAVVVLLVLLLILSVLNLAVEQVTAIGNEEYREIEEEFKRRSALLAQKEREIMERYQPEAVVFDTNSDTIPVREDSARVESDAPEISGSGRININTATLEELETLPGIGPTYARRIIKYRNKNDQFKSVEELVQIKGIGKKRLEKLKPMVKI